MPVRAVAATAVPALWAGFLTVLVAAPWLAPGYIFGTDWPGPRRFDFPNVTSSSVVLQITLALADKVVTAELAAKFLILGSFFLAALTSYRALPLGTFAPRAVAAVLYTVNPFVYGRLQYGQLLVLAGYAVLPWVATRMRLLVLEPKVHTAVLAALALTVLSVLDLHLLVPAAALMGALSIIHAWAERRNPDFLVRLARQLGVTVAVTLVASAYWLIPLAMGRGPEAQVVSRIGQADIVAYSTATDPQFGLLPNVLGLYGFWGEDTGRFVSMKAFVPLWPMALAALLVLAAIGANAVLDSRPKIRFAGSRPSVLGLLLAGAVAVVLDIGIADPHVAPIVSWLDAVFPPYRGMRDAGKWAALLALVYAQLVPLGIIAILEWTNRRLSSDRLRTTGAAIVIGLALALPLYYGNGLLFGAHGQIQPSQYPAGWYAADRVLAADPHPGRALFLPWHLYQSLDFVRNANAIVAAPAASFFSVPVVSSQDPEVPGIPPPLDNPDQATVSRLVAAGDQADWASRLASRGIKYVLLARETDWRSYQFLDRQPNLALVGDYGSVLLYRNLLWH